MKIQVTSTSVSKKGTIWIQAKIIEGEAPKTDAVFIMVEEQQPKEEKKNDE